MKTLTIEAVTDSKTGKSLRVKAGEDWYGANKDSGLTKGMTVEAEVSDGEYGKWIDKWKPTNGSAAPQVDGTASAQAKQSTTPGAAPAWLPFASNTVAHAINAGLIKEPADVKLWAAAAKLAYTELA